MNMLLVAAIVELFSLDFMLFEIIIGLDIIKYALLSPLIFDYIHSAHVCVCHVNRIDRIKFLSLFFCRHVPEDDSCLLL